MLNIVDSIEAKNRRIVELMDIMADREKTMNTN